MTFHDNGAIEIDGETIKNYKSKAMGNIDLKKAFSLLIMLLHH